MPRESDRLLEGKADEPPDSPPAPQRKGGLPGAPPELEKPFDPELSRRERQLLGCRERQFPLIGFCVVSFLLGFTWSTFAMLPDAAMKLLPVNLSDLAWLVNCNNMFSIPSTPLSIWLLASPPANADGSPSTGLRLTIMISAASLLLQTGLWSLAAIFPTQPWAVPALMIGSCFGGVGCTFAQGCVTRLSAVWFPQQLRGQATSIAFTAYFAGDAASYLASLTICIPSELRALLILQFAFSILIACPIAAFFPDAPKRKSNSGGPPSPREEDGEVGLLDGVRTLLFGPDALLVVVTVVIGGLYTAWQSMIPLMWDEAADEVGSICSADAPIIERVFSSKKAGDMLGLSSGIAYAIGGAVAGTFADLCFVKKLKRLITITLGMLALSFAPIVYMMPPPPWFEAGRTAPAAPQGVDFYIYFGLITMTGLFAGAAMPPALELLAESAYPVPEGTSANVVMLFYQVFAIVNTVLAGTSLAPEASNVLMFVLSTVGTILLPCARERYARSAARLAESEAALAPTCLLLSCVSQASCLQVPTPTGSLTNSSAQPSECGEEDVEQPRR